MSKCLVTGGAGFIASHLVEALVAAGHVVTVLDNLSTGKKENLDAVADRIRFIEGDIREAELVREVCKEQDIVFHYAALASVHRSFQEPDLNYSTNITGTFNVLDAAHQAAAAASPAARLAAGGQ